MEEVFDGYMCTCANGCVKQVDGVPEQRPCCDCPWCFAIEDLENFNT